MKTDAMLDQAQGSVLQAALATRLGDLGLWAQHARLNGFRSEIFGNANADPTLDDNASAGPPGGGPPPDEAQVPATTRLNGQRKGSFVQPFSPKQLDMNPFTMPRTLLLLRLTCKAQNSGQTR